MSSADGSLECDPMTVDSPVGRGVQLRRIAAAIDRARRGRAQTITLTGEAGCGKTTLLNAVVNDLPSDVQLLRAEGHRAESDIPFAGLHHLLLPVMDAVDAVGDPHRSRLRRALAGEGVAASDTLATADSLLRFIAMIAETQPVVVVVDDVQWIDPSSRRVLVFVARRLDADAVCFLFGARPEAEDDIARIGTTVEVGPLNDDDARALLRRSYPDLSTVVIRRIVEHAAGLPLALAEMPMELTSDQRCGAAPLPTRMPIGPTIERLYEHRLTALQRNERLALLLASFDDLDAEQLAGVLRRHDLDVTDFDAAERSRIVRIVDGRCVFRHPTVRSAVLNSATAAEMAAVHRTLAECLADDPLRHAYHLLRVPDVGHDVAVDALVDAATHAAGMGGFVEAADAWAVAARRTDSAPDRRMFQNEAVTCYLRAGAGPQAAALLDELIAASSRDEDRARRLAQLVVVSLWTQSVSKAESSGLADLGEKLACDTREEKRAAGLELLSALIFSFFTHGDYRAASSVAGAMRSAISIDRLPLEQRLLCDVIDVMVGAEGAGVWLRSDWIADYPWNRIADPSAPIGVFAAVLVWLGENDACARIADVARGRAQESESVAAQLAAGLMAAFRDHSIGRWDRAELEYAASEALALDTDFSAPYPFVALRHAYLLAAQGRAGDCERLREQARETAPIWTPALRHLDACVTGLLRLAVREFAEAAEALDAAANAETEVGAVVSGYTSSFPDRFEAYWHMGLAERLIAELRRFEIAGQRVANPTIAAQAARCRAMLVPDDEVDDAFAEATAAHERAGDVFELARTYLIWGVRLRRARRKAAARVRLTAAFAAFEALDARAWMDTARTEMAACGVRRVPDTVAGTSRFSTLTPREFDVAREVSHGATNAEAAQRLFISERTVEFHLSNVYRKLAVANRSDLGALFTE